MSRTAILMRALLAVAIVTAFSCEFALCEGGFLKTAVQQCWCSPEQTCLVEMLARFDVIVADLSEEQITAIRRAKPNAIILAFDSLRERGNWGLPRCWLADPSDYGSKRRVWWDVGDDCIRASDEGSYWGVPFLGRTYRQWRAEVALKRLLSLSRRSTTALEQRETV